MDELSALVMPFDLQVNKDLDRIRRTHERWVNTSGALASDKEKNVLLAVNIPKLVAYTVPTLSGDGLDLFTEFMAWTFLYDDKFDAPKERAQHMERAEALIREYRHVLYGGECPSDAAPLMVLWDDMLRRVESRVSREVVRRHRESWDDVYDAMQSEVKNDETSSILTFAEYLPIRRATGGVPVLLDWVEISLSFELPEVIRKDESLQAMRDHTADVVDMVNDVYSLPKELKCGNTNNAVLVLANEHDCSLEEAKTAVVRMVRENLERFQKREKEFRMGDGYRGLGLEDKRNVEVYVDTMKNWMVGSFEWHKRSGRYAV